MELFVISVVYLIILNNKQYTASWNWLNMSDLFKNPVIFCYNDLLSQSMIYKRCDKQLFVKTRQEIVANDR